MPRTIQLSEADFFKRTEGTRELKSNYLYIDEDGNLHVCLPIMRVGNTGVGLDNTCQILACLRSFFGYQANIRSIFGELSEYIEILSVIYGVSTNDPKVRNRLEQAQNYYNLFDSFFKQSSLPPLGVGLSHYPNFLQNIMNSSNSNVYTILLSPQRPDDTLASRNPTFTLRRGG